MLRKMGWADADIDGMAPPEVQDEVQRGRAAGLTVGPEEVAAAGTPASAKAAPPRRRTPPNPRTLVLRLRCPRKLPAPVVPDSVITAPENSDADLDATMNDAALASVRGLETEGQRTRPAVIQTPEQLEAAGARVNVEPTEAQKAAGNYKKSHVRVAGLDVTIENPKGSTRRGGAGGQPWEAALPAHYGYIKKTVGSDGDHVDVYVGDNPQSKKAYIVDQKAPSENGRFDEHKVILGADSLAQARELYLRAFSDGSGAQRLGAITSVSPKRLREWLDSDETGRAYAYGRTKLTESGFPADAKGKVKRPPSLTEFLARNGGIREDRGELAAMDAHKVFIPSVGKLVRPNGMTLDDARRLAVEHGYLSDARADQQSTSTVDHLLTALRSDIAHRNQYSMADSDWAAAYGEEQHGAEQEASTERPREEVHDTLNGLGIHLPGEFENAVLDLVAGGMSIEDAAERAAMDYDRGADVAPDADIPFFGDDDEVHAGTASESGPGDQAPSDGSARSAQEGTTGDGGELPSGDGEARPAERRAA